MFSKKLFSLLVLLLLVMALVPATMAAQPEPGDDENPLTGPAVTPEGASSPDVLFQPAEPQLNMQSILHIATTDTSQSVERALNELGYAYDIFNGSDWTGIDFSPYDIVIIGMDGGTVESPSVEKIRTDVVDQGKRVIFLGGTCWQPFALAVNQFLVLNDTNDYCWTVSSTPHFTVVDPGHPLAQGLPPSYNFSNSSAAYYALRATDPDLEVVAVNGDGYDDFFYKNMNFPLGEGSPAQGGDLIWFINSAYSPYWTNQADFDVLKQLISNSISFTGAGDCEVVLVENFETWPPPGWTIVNDGGDCVWESTAITGRTNYAGGVGAAADADSDWCGIGTTMNTRLSTPPLDLSGYTTATLQYVTSYNDIGAGGDYASTEASDDGGATWTSLLFWDEDHDANGPGEVVRLNLDAYTGGANSIISFYYGDATYDWWWEVDQVVITACVFEFGWLEGSVMDSELGDTEPPCTDAAVHVEPGGLDIPVRPDGTYGPSMLISGTYTVTATAPGFSLEMAMVEITTDMTTTQDFNLWRPVIEVAPTDLVSITGYVGYTETYPLVISNTGHLPLDFEIHEMPGSMATVEVARSYRPSPAAEGVDPFIYAELAASPDGQVDFFVAFRDTADLGPAYTMNWSDRGHFVVGALQAAADAAQGDVRAWLDERGIEYTSFWINNTLFLHADEATLNALAAFPEVSGFRGNHANQIMPVEAPETAGQTLTPAYPWNITFPMADQVHADFGIKGQGVVVGGMDTGVEYDHMGLVNNYRGNLGGGGFDHTYSWYDPANECGGGPPCDTHGHGTHTMGIMAGDDDPALPGGAWIGMAPDAQWIHCVGCPGGGCPDNVTDACAQWFLAPGGDPDMRPQVVNHSWGTWTPNSCEGNDYQAQLMAYRAADIVPAFAAGNVGDYVVPPHCFTSTSPANNTAPDGNPIAFSSGAHGPGGLIDSYSSGGPSACNNDNLFPDVAAPGAGSCTTQLGNTYYCGFGGTSAASPHTAGCVALVRAANPALTVDEVEQAIRDAADDVNDGCGQPGESPDWNNIYGEGHLDCYEAVELAFPQDIPWIWEDPISGTIPAEDGVTIDVSVTCTETGDLTATLSIMHNDPCLETIDVPVVLHCEECIPAAIIDVTTIITDLTVAFDADATGAPPITYVWDFGDGFGDVGEDVVHTYADEGCYTVTLEATNECGVDVWSGEVCVEVPFFYYYLPMLYKNG